MFNNLMRKYSKPVMVVLGVALMLIFVVNLSHGGSGGGGGTGIVGTMHGKTVTQNDLLRANIDFNVTNDLLAEDPHFAQLLYFVQSDTSQAKRLLHYYLLLTDARKNGLRVPTQYVQAALSSKALSAAEAAVSARTHLPRALVDRALADTITIDNYLNMARQALQVNRPQLAHAVAKVYSKVRLAYVRLRAKSFVQLAPPPSTSTLQQLFKQYKNVSQPEGYDAALVAGHHYPLGFKYPNRVKVEYLQIPRKPLLKTLKPTLADTINAYKFYRANKSTFVVAGRLQPFDAVKARLVRQQVDRRIAARMANIAREIIRATRQHWGRSTDTGFRKLVPPAHVARYGTVAAQVGRQFNVQIKVFRPKAWFSQQQLAALPGIGHAVPADPTMPRARFSVLAAAIEDLHKTAGSLALLLHLQTQVEGPVLRDSAGNYYVYRVVAAQKTHAPATLAAVRGEVVQAARLLWGYRHAIAVARQIASKARGAGLSAAAKTFHAHVHRPPPVSRQILYPIPWAPYLERIVQAKVPGLASSAPRVISAAFKLAEKAMPSKAKPAAKPRASATSASPTSAKPTGKAGAPGKAAAGISSQPLNHGTPAKGHKPSLVRTGHARTHAPTAVVRVEHRLEVFVVAMEHFSPVSRDKTQFSSPQAMRVRRAIQVVLNSAMQEKFGSLAAVEKRLDFKPVHGS